MGTRLHAGAHIGILGGGITGLTAAFYLLRSGFRVTILEARSEIGGLAGWYDFGSFHWDKFYHCILISDAALLELINDLGLKDELRWTETKVGFFTGDGFHSMSSTVDFLRFPLLSAWDKLRLGAGLLYASHIRDGKRLESIPVDVWLTHIFGRVNYEQLWEPLLNSKLGTNRAEASAAFIWATIRRLYSTRERSPGQRERLGYVQGGYRTVFLQLLDAIQNMGGMIRTGVSVRKITANSGQGIEFETSVGQLRFDQAVATAPSHIIEKIAPGLSADYRKRLNDVRYLGMVCVVLVLSRALTPYYVTNLTDRTLPFTGIVEMTNLISLDETARRHLVYIPKYAFADDPLFEAPDETVWKTFQRSLLRMFPDLSDTEVEKRFIFREKLVQPFPVLQYSDRKPQMETGLEGLLIANTTQIVNSTLNNNEMVKIARQAVRQVQERAGLEVAPQPSSSVELESRGVKFSPC